jgi:NAD-dependent deacetylase
LEPPERLTVNAYAEVAQLIRDTGNIVAFTGAGISVESGIPAFRGAQGLWEKYDPAEYADIRSFINQPAKVWGIIREMTRLIFDAHPSPAHIALAALEKADFLNTVVTQNVDGLHQAAGHTDVVEYHGNGRRLVCLRCQRKVPFTEDALHAVHYPLCSECREPLKPDGVFFGEQIPASAVQRAHEAIKTCRIMMIVGTSGAVYPAAEIPFLAVTQGTAAVEINVAATPFTSALSSRFLEGSASQVLPEIVEEMSLGTAS